MLVSHPNSRLSYAVQCTWIPAEATVPRYSPNGTGLGLEEIRGLLTRSVSLTSPKGAATHHYRHRQFAAGAGLFVLIGLLHLQQIIRVRHFADIKVAQFDELGSIDRQFEIENIIVLSEERHASNFGLSKGRIDAEHYLLG